MTRFLVGLAAISLSLAQTVQISVDRNRVEEGELFTLSIEVNGSDDFAKVDMNQLKDDFEILSGPGQQTNIQWINGSMTSTKHSPGLYPQNGEGLWRFQPCPEQSMENRFEVNLFRSRSSSLEMRTRTLFFLWQKWIKKKLTWESRLP